MKNKIIQEKIIKALELSLFLIKNIRTQVCTIIYLILSNFSDSEILLKKMYT